MAAQAGLFAAGCLYRSSALQLEDMLNGLVQSISRSNSGFVFLPDLERPSYGILCLDEKKVFIPEQCHHYAAMPWELHCSLPSRKQLVTGNGILTVYGESLRSYTCSKVPEQ
jgi:hypothetical protein